MTNVVQLMIDGDHAIALLGADLQSGACVCVQVQEVNGSRYTPQAQRTAAQAAFEGLKAQVGQPNLRYALHPSHPDFGAQLDSEISTTSRGTPRLAEN
jgi:hypothetical protein